VQVFDRRAKLRSVHGGWQRYGRACHPPRTLALPPTGGNPTPQPLCAGDMRRSGTGRDRGVLTP
jgi:hypothetical protein